MELLYKQIPPSEGGSAIVGCGTIHRSEIKDTLTRLSDQLEFPFDLNDYVIGSTGKREYSGDIDLVLDDKWWGHGPVALIQNLIEQFGSDNVAKNGAMVHLKYPIVGYDETKDRRKPRTGFVQVDFNLGDPDWERFYHYSPGDKSAYKGAHRNLAISAVCSAIVISKSAETDTYNRPVRQVRWKFGSNGFIKVLRESKKERHSNIWKKKQDDTVLDGPHTDPMKILGVLFPETDSLTVLESLEGIMGAVKDNYGMVDQERIWRQMAKNFSDWSDGKYFIYPSEINEYFLTKDK